MTSKEKLIEHVSNWNSVLRNSPREDSYILDLKEDITDTRISVKLVTPLGGLEVAKIDMWFEVNHKEQVTERAYNDLLQSIFNMGISRMIKMESILKR